ncbi:MAG: N-(5-phosphoribosyl)anthranilate isomerase [Herbinix sp.]|jgi:phosphoribosylanthranilate isomerase|nr:N-(5-phosphoribosyl)anthranilate isomerase [Herbinix sp.]
MTKIKICGLSRKADILAVNEVMPDYIGFVFARSRRQVSEETALELKELLRPEILSIGVFVNDEIDYISHLCDRGIIDIVQLHGDESTSYIHQLREYIKNPIIKAIRVSGRDAIIDELEDELEDELKDELKDDLKDDLKDELEDQLKDTEVIPCDYLLLDTYHKEQYGGTGESFDWSVIPKLSKPYFLAGGISIANVVEAINCLHPFCVDVSSSVETAGYKDATKIKEIVMKVRTVPQI